MLNRREFVATLGGALVAAAGSTAWAQQQGAEAPGARRRSTRNPSAPRADATLSR